MSTADGKAPRLEIEFQHDDGNVKVTFEVTFEGDVRNLGSPEMKELSQEDAELHVAGNFFQLLGAAAGAGAPPEDGTTEADDREVLK